MATYFQERQKVMCETYIIVVLMMKSYCFSLLFGATWFDLKKLWIIAINLYLYQHLILKHTI